jgi:hypothetical protein
VRQHGPEHVLRHRPVEDSMSVRDDHVGIPQFVEQQRVDAGRRHVNPLE